jgi:2-keto-4-pentenoate hydratase/2-oxohepta-3-ene-1,7-dioic acid hydratase in catechol pathway
MKLVKAKLASGAEIAGQLKDGKIHVLPDGMGILDVLALDAGARQSLEASLAAGPSVELAAAQLQIPVRPTSLKDFMGFERHLAGALKWMFPNGGGPGGGKAGSLPEKLYERPMFYVCDNSALLGPEDPLIMPPRSNYLDCEVELAAVMARGGRDLTPEQAGQAIGGYTIFLDWSARDVLTEDVLAPTKGKDCGNTLGPCVVTADEIEKYRVGDRLKVPMKLTRNGEVIGEGDTEESIYSIEEMIAYVSRGATVLPGDVIAIGTAPKMCWVEHWGNNGEATPAPIAVGDVISMEVAGIGGMSISVKSAAPFVELPRARSYL